MYKTEKEIISILIKEVEVSLNEYIGTKVLMFRKSKGITQVELAEILEVQRTSISNIENGVQQLSMEKLEKLCAFFNIKSTEILPF
jgi:transcriptional regulator with XRE-family HTH domain